MTSLVDKMQPMRGEIVLRVLDRGGVCQQRHEFRNTITYIAPMVLMDLLAQNTLDVGPVQSFGASHPADAARGFGAATNLVSDPNRNAIRYMRLGKDNTAAARAQTGVIDQIDPAGDDGTEILQSISFPSNAAIRFVALFGAAKANISPLEIQEVSLWTRGSSLVEDLSTGGFADSRMFARQIHGAIAKTDQMQLEYTWTIYFS